VAKDFWVMGRKKKKRPGKKKGRKNSHKRASAKGGDIVLRHMGQIRGKGGGKKERRQGKGSLRKKEAPETREWEGVVNLR